MSIKRSETKEEKGAKLSTVTSDITNAEIKQALIKVVQEWRAAENLFNEATEESVIDAAIKAMGEAESRYKEIILQAREIGCRLPVTIDGYEERRKLLCLNWN
ncbi:MAG: hypothetical protein GX893_00195 [Firmicutes bacterium]|nr:hypothetical protein [Bacillota bacterium]